MDLLNKRRFLARRRQAMRAKRLHRGAPAAAGKADGHKPTLVRGLQRRDHVRRAPRRRNCDEHVARLAQSAHLPLKCSIEAVIVADRGQNRTVGGQCDRGQRIAIKIQPRQEFAGDVLSIRRTAAIAGNQ